MSEARLIDALGRVAEGGLRVREEAIAELLATPPARLVPFLVARISEPVYRIRNAALEVLGRLGETGLDELARQALEVNDETRMFLAPVLGNIQHPAALDLLHGWLRAEDPNLVAMTCEAVARHRHPASIEELAALIDRDPWMAGPAITAIGRIGHPAGRGPLLRALNHEEHCMFAVGALGRLADPTTWPALAAVLEDDPGLIAVVIDDLDPLLARLSPVQVRAGIGAQHVWREAVMDALGAATPAPAAARLAAALELAEAAPRLIEVYLEADENDVILEALQHLPGADHALRVRLDDALGDEASRRSVRLVGALLPEAGDVLMRFLAHPAESVRLEIVVDLDRRSLVPELLAALLSDPDALVRSMALQVLRRRWEEPGLARRIAEEIDADALPIDVLEALAAEAPAELADAVGSSVRRRVDAKADGNARRLRWSYEARRNPEALLARIADPALSEAELLELLPLAAGLADASALPVLVALARRPQPAVAYAAAEALVRHPLLKPDVLVGLLRETPHLALRTVLAAWAADHGEGWTLIDDLLALRGPHEEALEREILRALRRHRPGPAKARFRLALESGSWRLQIEGLRGLEAVGEVEAWLTWQDRIHPLAREVLEAGRSSI